MADLPGDQSKTREESPANEPNSAPDADRRPSVPPTHGEEPELRTARQYNWWAISGFMLLLAYIPFGQMPIVPSRGETLVLADVLLSVSLLGGIACCYVGWRRANRYWGSKGQKALVVTAMMALTFEFLVVGFSLAVLEASGLICEPSGRLGLWDLLTTDIECRRW